MISAVDADASTAFFWRAAPGGVIPRGRRFETSKLSLIGFFLLSRIP